MSLKELFARFKSVEKIKSGGQKQVFLAIDNDNNKFALKIILNSNDLRVTQEINIIENLNTDYIPKIFEHGLIEVNEEQKIYIIEQYIEGDSLRDILKKGKIFNLKEAYNLLNVLLTIELVLEKAGILHRDINPNNIMMTNESNFYLIDFGLAKILGGDGLTKTDAMNGPFTAGYAPHEQITNRKFDQDVRTDLFQIGVTIYEMCTGVNPFQVKGDIYATLHQTMTLIPKPLYFEEDKLGNFSKFIEILMAKNMSQRPDNSIQAINYLNAIYNSLEINS